MSTTSYAWEVSGGEITDEQIDKAIDQEIYEDDDEEMTSFIQSHEKVNGMTINANDQENAEMHTEVGFNASSKKSLKR